LTFFATSYIILYYIEEHKKVDKKGLL